MDAWTRSGGGYISSMDEVGKKARKPMSGSVLSGELSMAKVWGLSIEGLTSGKLEGLRAERGSLSDVGVRGGCGETGGRRTSMDAALS